MDQQAAANSNRLHVQQVPVYRAPLQLLETRQLKPNSNFIKTSVISWPHLDNSQCSLLKAIFSKVGFPVTTGCTGRTIRNWQRSASPIRSHSLTFIATGVAPLPLKRSAETLFYTYREGRQTTAHQSATFHKTREQIGGEKKKATHNRRRLLKKLRHSHRCGWSSETPCTLFSELIDEY